MSTSTSRKRPAPRRRPHPDETPVGEMLRQAREEVGLTQVALARQLKCSQQAIAQAERANANHTVEFLRRWARACKRRLSIQID